MKTLYISLLQETDCADCDSQSGESCNKYIYIIHNVNLFTVKN